MSYDYIKQIEVTCDSCPNTILVGNHTPYQWGSHNCITEHDSIFDQADVLIHKAAGWETTEVNHHTVHICPICFANSMRKIPDPTAVIDKLVRKRSKKPFKSGHSLNTVKAVTTNPNSGKVAFTFYEDDSIVDVYQCRTQVIL